ncbi:MAG TPA: DNA-directed RNA polymerase subunit beta [Fervidobacterium sp.]|nr:DNA-directed RNA polymerase subunit beta [Fervidobacterium sp.]HOL03605.1 DNA-directed RNA polymerase subunit beta [Fervidobacterium sp.]HPC79609.1 DNA-directed RNA polymerase subunit beta [Fervidobacterium sp.]HRB91001.1 DNA-directed RNA polymerase subunit beta [Fervidobacterium sp.]HRT01733.1 DNA-directed RNA polymerase subunit beta [Fervidobacterium sp.]
MKTYQIGKRTRYSFGKVDEIVDVPDLVSIQHASFKELLDSGILKILKKFSPITSAKTEGRKEKGFRLDFVNFRVGEPLHSVEECKQRLLTYVAPFYATVRVTDVSTDEMREEEVTLGNYPVMTENQTFVINGVERVVVSQLVRSPGVYFVEEPTKTIGSKPIYLAHFLPVRGVWLEIMLNLNDEVLYARIDRRKRLNFFLVLKTLGFSSDLEILSLFPTILDVEDDYSKQFEGIILLEDVVTKNGSVLAEKGSVLTSTLLDILREHGIEKIKVVNKYVFRTYAKLKEKLKLSHDEEISELRAYMEINKELRPGEVFRYAAAKSYWNNLYFSEEKFELSEVGRYKMNKKLTSAYRNYLIEIEGRSKRSVENIEYTEKFNALTPMDIVLVTRMLLETEKHPETLDTKDHLSNKRVKTVGELIGSEFERAFSKSVHQIEEKLSTYTSLDKIPISSLINLRNVIASLNSFFATNPLSQFMDQVNPIAELTHKRRLTAVGPGGLKRERARFEVRDVHHSHYGRMCPIETPEGGNIGLITSLSVYATIDKFGFLVTPYRKVVDGKLTDEVAYLAADEEENYKIASATIEIDDDGYIVQERVPVRHMEKILYVSKEEVEYVDVSPRQIVSVTTALIPFLEHDDANRALMGSNMQRQGVPLVKPEAPLVGAGMEYHAALYSGNMVLAKHDGIVKKSDGRRIVIHRTNENGELMYDKKGNPILDEYGLLKYIRSNQDTAITQRPIVSPGDVVKKGTPIADGPATDNGELALGKNVLVAFVPWEGYNFEDAILVSEELLEEDAFTSVHVEVYETTARETRVGPEEITSEIPNVSKENLRNLDENGIIRVGAYVGKQKYFTSQDILVGKVTPKGESDASPEEKIMRSVFGEKGKDVKDSSLRVPHGVEGRVIGVNVFYKEEVGDLGPGVNTLVRVYVATRKPLDVGDKLAGRHGNKGVVSMILPKEDMPFLPDGTPVQVVLSPLGVPSRMNIGQVLETSLGWLAKLTNRHFATPVFDGAKEDDILPELYNIRKSLNLHYGDDPENPSGKVTLRDGRTGKEFDSPILVGYMYIMKLVHIARDKIHARATGPYSLIHQQPLGGKAQFGGQRFGEMEVWALEAYGASYTLNEMLTVKSDDIKGRTEVYKAIMKGKNLPEPGLPESFKVLVRELKGLALDVRIYDESGNEIDIEKL